MGARNGLFDDFDMVHLYECSLYEAANVAVLFVDS